MKKVLLTLLLCCGIFCAFQANAGAKEDFEAYIAACQKNVPAGVKVIGDFQHRVIYGSWPLNVQSSQVDRSKTPEIKRGMLNMIKKFPKDVKIIKRLNIILVYCYITSDRQAITITLSPNEL